jgi:hypothetical protein
LYATKRQSLSRLLRAALRSHGSMPLLHRDSARPNVLHLFGAKM